jgi:tetratricopeptide (TPR) repeat protein
LDAASGDVNLALKELKAAERIDGEDGVTQLHLGVVYYFQRHYEPAIDQFKSVAAMLSNSAGAHYRLGRTCEAYAEQLRAMGENEKARDEYIQAIDENERTEIARGHNLDSTTAKYDLERKAFKESGAVGWYQARLDYLKRNQPGAFYDQARMYARLGNIDEALKSLEKGWRTRDGEMVKLLEDDCWAAMRERSEFKVLLRKMDLRPVTSVGRGKTAPAN